MNRAIKDSGGVLVRVVEALKGFRTKHGYWPTSLEAPPLTISLLATHHLTPLGFFLLQSKLDVIEADEERIIARGEGDDAFDYGAEGWRGEHQHDALVWLGLDS